MATLPTGSYSTMSPDAALQGSTTGDLSLLGRTLCDPKLEQQLLPPGARVLGVGVGGAWVQALRARGHEVVWLEPGPEQGQPVRAVSPMLLPELAQRMALRRRRYAPDDQLTHDSEPMPPPHPTERPRVEPRPLTLTQRPCALDRLADAVTGRFNLVALGNLTDALKPSAAERLLQDAQGLLAWQGRVVVRCVEEPTFAVAADEAERARCWALAERSGVWAHVVIRKPVLALGAHSRREVPDRGK